LPASSYHASDLTTRVVNGDSPLGTTEHGLDDITVQTFGVVNLSPDLSGPPQGECVENCEYDNDFQASRYKFLPTALCVYHKWNEEEWGDMDVNQYLGPNDFCSDGDDDATPLHARFTADSFYEKDYIHLDGYGVWHNYRKYSRATDGTHDISSSALSEDSGYLGAGWFTYQGMCISDCRDTATVLLDNPFGDDTFGSDFFSMYNVADENGVALEDAARADHLTDYPPMIYNFDNECRARCAMSKVENDEPFDMFAHPETNKCGRVCPSIEGTDYYA
jgi:hypothetical protein